MKKINFDLSFIEEKENTNSYEILKENSNYALTKLKKMIEPFILRRMKKEV